MAIFLSEQTIILCALLYLHLNVSEHRKTNKAWSLPSKTSTILINNYKYNGVGMHIFTEAERKSPPEYTCIYKIVTLEMPMITHTN